MQKNYGINLEQQLQLVETRLDPVMRTRGFKNYSDFLDYLDKDKSGDEARFLVTRLTTNYTYFMREVEHYNFLTKTVLPEVTARAAFKKDLRIWSAGCSSGEEAYTTAMVLDDYLGVHKKEWDARILATDISPQVLQTASTGVYGPEKLAKLNPAWRTRYFSPSDRGRFQIKQNIKDEVILKTFNLMDKFCFPNKFHVIFCRNVMIYFNTKTCNDLINRFYDYLEPGGYLFVGLSESVDINTCKFKYVQPSIYRK